MQNWKIKRMKYEEVESNIKACNKFLRVYKKGKYTKEFYCLFCDISERFHPQAYDKCDYCSWKIFENISCSEFSEDRFGDDVPLVKSMKAWRKARIPMLKRWKKILQTEKDNRTEGGG